MNIYEKLGPTCWFFEKIAEIQSWRGVDSPQANTTWSQNLSRLLSKKNCQQSRDTVTFWKEQSTIIWLIFKKKNFSPQGFTLFVQYYSAICRPEHRTVGRPRAEIRSLETGTLTTRPPHLLILCPILSGPESAKPLLDPRTYMPEI